MGVGINVLNILDGEINKCLDQETPEDILIKLYIDFWRTLKLRVGTSSNFTGISDYLFFRYVLKRVERRLGLTLSVEQCTQDTCMFSSDCLLLTSNLLISKFDPNAPKQKTDIAIFTRNSLADHWRVLAAFEIKIGVSDQKKLDDMLIRLSTVLTCSEALVFPVVFNSLNIGAQYKSQLDGFCERSNERAFIITRSDLNYYKQIGLNEAIEKCLATLHHSHPEPSLIASGNVFHKAGSPVH